MSSTNTTLTNGNWRCRVAGGARPAAEPRHCESRRWTVRSPQPIGAMRLIVSSRDSDDSIAIGKPATHPIEALMNSPSRSIRGLINRSRFC